MARDLRRVAQDRSDNAGKMDMRARLIAAVVSTVLTVTSASATVIISDDVGGKMQDYTTHFRQVRDSGERVVIASGTQDLMQTYPAPVRAWIARRGGLTPKMMYLRGRDLAAIVAPCNSSRVASASRAKRFGGAHQVADTNTPRASFDAR